VPKNFDELYEGDREFVLAGETFKWSPVHWRKYGDWFDEAQRKDEEEAEARTNGELPLTHTFERLIGGIVLYMEAEEAERFQKFVHDQEHPVTAVQLNSLFTWLTEVQANRPTDQPSPSDAGRGSDAPTLQAV